MKAIFRKVILSICMTTNLFALIAADKNIRKIIVSGNKYIKKEAILQRLPFKEGELFDSDKTPDAIHHVYALGYFKQIKIESEDVGKDKVDVYVTLSERKLLEGISFEGNSVIKSKKISEKLELDKLETVDEEHLARLAVAIQDMYKEENFHFSHVAYKVIVNKDNKDKAKVVFQIDEGKKARIKRIKFKGNKFLPDRKLRTIIFTREDWLLGILDDSGKYSEDSLEMDKKRIEYYYRDYGFLMAKVAKVDVDFARKKSEISVTFHIREGDRFKIRYLSAPGDEVFTEDELLPHISLEAGKPFSQSKLVESINELKSQWGDVGYIYADVYPQIIPNEVTKEVDITFHVERGKKMFLNRINITGNKVTKDRVIRREITPVIEEGDLITSRKLSESKMNVEYLGFFERGSANWVVNKLKDDRADLEMHVEEARTGHLNVGMSYGTDKGTAARTIRGTVDFEKANFLGRGFDVGSSVQASIKRFQKATVHYYDPHIFDSDVSTGVNLYVKQEEYDQWKDVHPTPLERTYGAVLQLGFELPRISRRTRLSIEVGAEHVRNNHPVANASVRRLFQPIIDERFKNGDQIWFGLDIGKDTRNHKVYPNEGYKILWSTKTSPPGINDQFDFIKTELDWSWYNALIGEDSLVLALHAHGGVVTTLLSNRTIPYKELYHMGGQDTVRGFVFGGVGPAWHSGDPLGARKAFQFNAELVFPLVPDYQMKGHVFYDSGAGWDTPKTPDIKKNMQYITRNKFKLRHSVGFGINLSSPFPAKIDWGYKLDRDKKAGESAHEFHLSMNSAW